MRRSAEYPKVNEMDIHKQIFKHQTIYSSRNPKQEKTVELQAAPKSLHARRRGFFSAELYWPSQSKCSEHAEGYSGGARYNSFTEIHRLCAALVLVKGRPEKGIVKIHYRAK
jgi:hypothetical protein